MIDCRLHAGMARTARSAYQEYEKELEMIEASEGKKPEENDVFQEREYQTYLVRLAKQKNIIVCLPTGSGKTFIGLQLTREYLPEARRQKRKIIFLANTVPLVNQQAEYFRSQLTNTFLNENSDHVECLTGDRNVDVWKGDRWEEVLSERDVLLMTTQIFVDALNHGYITLSRVKLLILDECHHTAKDSPMNQVMLRYRDAVKNDGNIVDVDNVPRILGLTATIILGKKDQVEKEVKDAEERLCATAVTYHKYEKVLEHSTCAKVEFKLYNKTGSTVWDPYKPALFDDLNTVLQMVFNTNEKLTTKEAAEIDHHSFRSESQRFDNKEAAHDFLRRVVKEVKDVCDDLGLYCAKIIAVHKRAFLHTVIYNKDDNIIEKLIKSVDSALELFIVRAEKVMGVMTDFDQLTCYRTDKTAKIVEILQDYKSGDDLRGLIFADRRIVAQGLCWYLQDLAAIRSSPFNFLRVGFIVGSATYGMDPIETRVTINEQKTVISKFRKGEYNLLVATRVLEEGLDVPGCNLVVRIDKIQTYPSYVQSMGRARHKNSRFLGLIDEKKQSDEIQAYTQFEVYNKQLSAYLRDNAIHADNEFDEDTCSSPEEQAVPDFEPNPGQPPRITAVEAISITQRYCQILSCDKFVPLAPVYWWEAVEPNQYKAYVQFPINSVIREIVEGEAQDTKVLAKRSAALQACKLLYKRHQLNEKLFPVPQHVTPIINAFMDSVAVEKESEKDGEGKIGSKKRTQWYRKRIANRLNIAKVLAGTQLRAYVIQIDLYGMGTSKADSYTEVRSLYNFVQKDFALCILTPIDMNEIPLFLLHVNPTVGNVVVTLEAVNLRGRENGIVFNDEELTRLKEFENYIFEKLLRLKRPHMKDQVSSILVAPVRKTGQDKPDGFKLLDWDLMEKIAGFSKEFNAPDPEERKKFVFVEEDYKDALVIPWYRPEKEKIFFTVTSVKPDSSPGSKFEVNAQYASYADYFTKKYPNVQFIANMDQKLLRAKPIASNLNFFRSGVNYKKSHAERKEGRDNIVELIPELTVLHPLPASLYVQAKFVPSVLQRINRFLSAKDIIDLIARGSRWSSLTCERKDYKEEFAYLMQSNPADLGEVLPVKKGRMDQEYKTLVENAAKKLKELELHPVGKDDFENDLAVNGDGIIINKAVPSIEGEVVLDFLHPKEITFSHVQKIRLRSERYNKIKALNMMNGSLAYMDDRGWKHERETDIDLIDINEIKFAPLETEFDYRPEQQPSMYTIMQAITLEGSMDSVNLERLEMIGDSFLKYCVTRHIFYYYHKLDEGGMTQWRSRLISNSYLYSQGKKLSVGEYLASGIFRPESGDSNSWLPPCYQVPNNLVDSLIKIGVNDDVFNGIQNMTDVEMMTPGELDILVNNKKNDKWGTMQDHLGCAHARVSDKGIADSVEALIGAYYVTGGIGGALHVMEKVGLRGPYPENGGRTSSIPYGRAWEPYSPKYNIPEEDNVSDHLPFYDELEKLIEYKFKNPWLLVEAFSHPCYLKNRVTECYQRLEFLGDAVLDFLVTNHIYKANVSLNPGELTDLRAALVNNVTFGSLAVRYRLDTYILHNQKALQDAISLFVECQMDNGHQVTGHFSLLSDSECALVSDIDCPKVLGDVFESLAGAVFVDSGMSLDATWKVFYRLMKNEIDTFSVDVPKNPVRILNEAHPGSRIFNDITQLVYAQNPNKSPGMSYVALSFKVAREDGEEIPVIGRGKNKQSAKLAAAKYYNKLLKRNSIKT